MAQAKGEQNCKLFIGGLNFDTVDDGLRQHFSQWGEVIDCVVMKDAYSKKSRGFGFVTYKEPDCVDEAQKNRPHVIDGKEVEVKRAVPREVWNNCPEAHATVKKLFVGGIKEELEKEEIETYFGQFGNVDNVEMKVEKDTGKKRGFCFVLFDDYDPVDKCVLMKTHHINGIRCEAKKALAPIELAQIQMRNVPNYNYRYGYRGGRGGRGGSWGMMPNYTAEFDPFYNFAMQYGFPFQRGGYNGRYPGRGRGGFYRGGGGGYGGGQNIHRFAQSAGGPRY